MEYLVVRIREGTAPPQWAVFDEDGRVVQQADARALEEAVEAAAGRRVIVLVSAVDVIVTEATLPKVSAAKQRKMLPFALEDALAEDVDELVFAVGPRLESGGVAVTITARERLEGWLEQLSSAGLSPSALYSEAEGVPDTPSTLTLVIEDQRVYGRVPGRPPFVFEGLSLEQILAVVDESGELKHALVYVDDAGRARFADDLDWLGERIASTQVKLMADGALYRFGATLIAQPGTNLLQGPYAPKSNIGTLLKPWRAAAGLLIGLVLLSFVTQAAEYWALRQHSRQLNAHLTEMCAEAFSTPGLDACRSTVRSRLSESGLLDARPGGFLPALTVVAEARAPESRVSALSYQNGVMDMRLTVPDVAALEAFRSEVERSERFEMRILTTDPGPNGVEGSVQIIQSEAVR